MVKDPFIVVNPNANTARLGKNLDKALKKAEEYLGKFDYAMTEGPRHEKELAQKAIDEGYKTLISLGGDGTATNMGDVIIGHPDVTLGLISAGSMCDWHKTHSIPYHLEDSLAVLVEGHREKFPAIKCKGDEESYAFDMTDGGFTGKATEATFTEMKWLKIGAIKYNYLGIKYMLKFKNTPCTISIDDQEPFKVDELINFFVALGDDIAGFRVLPGNADFSAKNKDLGISILHSRKGLGRVSMFLKAMPGKHLGIGGAWFTRGRKFKIESHGAPLICSTEGEIYNEKGSTIEAERIDDAITLIVPKEREYKAEYDEAYFYENYEDTFKKRSLDEVMSSKK
ncbi:MAG: diacylglycerol/lipid kinase family protein [Candidatus Heimdallarchaeaceae archaeon]